MPRNVVVTGIGLVTPCGWGREVSWEGVLKGRSTAVRLPELGPDLSGRTLWSGMPVPKIQLSKSLRLRRFVHSAAAEALHHAQLRVGKTIAPQQLGCVIGTSKSDLTACLHWSSVRQAGVCTTMNNSDPVWPQSSWIDPPSIADGADEMSLRLIEATLRPNDPACLIAEHWNVEGPCLSPVAACATGLISIIRGVDLIRDGACDATIVGSVDASLTPSLLSCYGRMRVLAQQGGDPARAVRPFDRDRRGFLVGEGAGVLVLESEDFALRRGAHPLARILGASLGSDPSGMTDVDPEGTALAHVICRAFEAARVEPEEIDAIHLHGTATRQNDLCESRAIRGIWQERLIPPACSLKGTIGHLLGGAGSVEAGCAILSLRDQVVPPTANLEHPDPECPLSNLPTRVHHGRFRRILKLSLGFGGHLAALVLERP